MVIEEKVLLEGVRGRHACQKRVVFRVIWKALEESQEGGRNGGVHIPGA